jgi:hypothetical protein
MPPQYKRVNAKDHQVNLKVEPSLVTPQGCVLVGISAKINIDVLNALKSGHVSAFIGSDVHTLKFLLILKIWHHTKQLRLKLDVQIMNS